MGIPAFFRWLSDKYPKVTAPVKEVDAYNINGIETIVDATQPNPNGIEFDNLYLDMNGIIHPCCHPEGRPPPSTEDEMYVEIYKYIDRIMNMIRPRRVLYMAVDGVAPRAKMNQQRSRRFRAALEAEFPEMVAEKIKSDLRAKGTEVKEKTEGEKFDSNCITPGTPFMDRLSDALRYYIADRMNNNPAWRGIKVILSDASVPGEGEHKIMDYIRVQRNQKGYYPNTRHILYGLDADLIMLALATHEPNFHILREDVFYKPERDYGKKNIFNTSLGTLKPFIFLHVHILREYLRAELSVQSDSNFRFDLDRAIDDWIFLCAFVGNDFLPHLPSLEIREGAIDKLISIWKRNVHYWGGYITDSGKINLKLVEPLMIELGKHEDEVFIERKETEDRRSAAQERRQRHNNNNENENNLKRRRDDSELDADQPPTIVRLLEQDKGDNLKVNEDYKLPGSNEDSVIVPKPIERENTETTNDDYNVPTPDSNEEIDEGLSSVDETNSIDPVEDSNELEKKFGDNPPVPDDNIIDEEVKLWEVGWKQRYYISKFQIEESNDSFRREVVTRYVEGLCWVLQYYYQGCQSWNWYYPYHYAPFASDFDFISEIKVNFVMGQPFHPFEQLMAVLPAYSGKHIPEPFRNLMTDEESTILDFYPRVFKIDLNGKKFLWQGVALLPFIDEKRLLDALKEKYCELTPDEIRRNSRGNEILFVSSHTTIYDQVCENIDFNIPFGENQIKAPVEKPAEVTATENKPETETEQSVKLDQDNHPIFTIDWRAAQKFFGSFSRDPKFDKPGADVISPIHELGLEDVKNNQSLSVRYYFPVFHPGFKFPARRIPGARDPRPVLSPQEVYDVRNGIVRNRFGPGYRGRGGGGFNNGGHRNNNQNGRFNNNDRRNNNQNGRFNNNDRRNNNQNGRYNNNNNYRNNNNNNYKNSNNNNNYNNSNNYNNNYNNNDNQPTGYSSNFHRDRRNNDGYTSISPSM